MADQLPAWNSGRRESSWYPIELARLEILRKQMTRREEELRAVHGTHWPKEQLDRFVQKERSLRGRYEELDDEQWEPWFPPKVITAIEDALTEVTTEASPKLLEELWNGLERLVSAKGDAVNRGEPRLNSEQRRRLERVNKAVWETIVACGQDVKATQLLIGNWAEAGLLNGQTLEKLVSALCVLNTEVSLRLSRDTPRSAHRPKDKTLKRFCVDVAVALLNAGEPLPLSRRGSMDRVLRVLLQSSHQRVPVDLFKHIKTAIASAPKERLKRSCSAARFQEFLSEKPSSAVTAQN
jgi:hypothetical protein